MSEFDTNLDAQTVSTLEETDKKCPSCGGVMDFDPATGGLSCPYCGYTQEIKADQEVPGSAEELDFASAESVGNCDWGVLKKTVLCQSCGAESVYDALEISAVCPFCGSNQVMEASDKSTTAPGGVIPFQITDQKASELFKTWIRKKWFCPKMAKESAKAKSFKGIYLPYWTFDAKTDSDYQGEYGKNKTVRDRDGKTHIETSWHPTSGTYEEAIDDELICASTQHNQSMLNGLEPYRTAENKSYKPEYVAGFAAERYSVGLKEAWQLAKESIKFKLMDSIERVIRKRHNADEVRNLRVQTSYHAITYKYLLLPVWISSYKYKDKLYRFMVNGQTGKVSGKTPISIPKVIIAVLGVAALIAIIYFMGIQS